MNLNLISWIIAYSVSLIGITALILTAVRDHSDTIRLLVAVFGSILLIIIPGSLVYLLVALMPRDTIFFFSQIMNLVCFTGIGLFTIFLPRFLASTGVMTLLPWQNTFLFRFTGSLTVLTLAGGALFIGGSGEISELIYTFSQLVLLSIFTFSGLWCFILVAFFPRSGKVSGFVSLRVFSFGGILFFILIYFNEILVGLFKLIEVDGFKNSYFLAGFSIFFNIIFIFYLASHRHHTASAPIKGACEKFGITSRETDVIEQLLLGRTYKEIADELCIAVPTVQSHVNRIYRKTGARNKVELGNLLH